MTASMTTLAAVLLDDNTDMLIHDTFNSDVAAWEDFDAPEREWQGNETLVRIRAGRNKSVRSAANSTEPGAGNQTYLVLRIQAKRVLGKAGIDDFTLESAKSTKGSLAAQPEAELKGLIEDFKKKVCKFVFVGGPTIGLVWQRSAVATTYGYRGRWDDVQVGNANNTVQFRRMDTYALVGVPTQVTAITNRTITLGANINTSAVPAGVPIAVELDAASFQYTNLIAAFPDPEGGTMEVEGFSYDPSGLITNLCQDNHWGNVKSTNLPVGSIRLRSNFAVVGNTNAQGGDNPSPTDFAMLQARTRTASGNKSDRYWCSAISAVAWGDVILGAGAAHVTVEAKNGIGRADPMVPAQAEKSSFSGVAAGGIELHTSEECPDGLLFMIKNESWERSFKGPKQGKWVTDGQGSPLIKENGSTDFGATRAMYFEQHCNNPRANAILVGIADPV